MTVTDRTGATQDEFTARLAAFDARQPVDIARDVQVEKVARAIAEADGHDFDNLDSRRDPKADSYRDMASAALDAMTPADEGLRALLVWLAAEGYEVKGDDADGPGLTPDEVLDRYRAAVGGAS